MITVAYIKRLAPRCSQPQMHASALEAARVNSSVNTPRRLAHFMGQVLIETDGLTALVENMAWRDPVRLDALFSAVRGVDDAQALIRRGQAAIADRVYGGRLGNGPESSGDGWRYRGSGYKQLTGRANYAEVGALIGLDLVSHPEWARDPIPAARIAFAFWDARGCSALADAADDRAITRIVNGPALLKLTERQAAAATAMKVWQA